MLSLTLRRPYALRVARRTSYALARYYSAGVEAVPNKRKIWDSVDEAVKEVKSGDTVLVGGAYH